MRQIRVRVFQYLVDKERPVEDWQRRVLSDSSYAEPYALLELPQLVHVDGLSYRVEVRLEEMTFCPECLGFMPVDDNGRLKCPHGVQSGQSTPDSPQGSAEGAEIVGTQAIPGSTNTD